MDHKYEIISRKEAKKKGLKFYYTGKKCKRGHLCERYVSSYTCVECAHTWSTSEEKKQYDKQYLQENKDHRNKYYQDNKEHIKQRQKQHYQENKECYKQRWKQYHLDNRERRKQYSKQYYHSNKEYFTRKFKKYCQENRAHIAARNAKRRTQKLKATPKWLTADDNRRIREMYALAKIAEDVCGESFHVDHIVPLTHPAVCGLHVPDNLQLLSAEENLQKGNRYEL